MSKRLGRRPGVGRQGQLFPEPVELGLLTTFVAEAPVTVGFATRALESPLLSR